MQAEQQTQNGAVQATWRWARCGAHHPRAAPLCACTHQLAEQRSTSPHAPPCPSPQIYDADADKWRLGAKLPWDVGSASTALIGDTVYLCGGISGGARAVCVKERVRVCVGGR